MATIMRPPRHRQQQAKPAFCEGCPLEKERRLAPLPSRQIDLLVIGPAPMPEDISKGRFRSKSGSIFRAILDELQAGVPKSGQARVDFTYAVDCCAGRSNNFKAPAGAVKQCSTRLQQDLARLNPKVILLLGADTLKPFGFAGKIKDYRGNIYTRGSKTLKRYIVPTFSPVQITRKPGLTESFKLDVGKALDCIIDGIEDIEFDLRCPEKFDDIMYELDRVCADLKEQNDQGLKVGMAMDTETTSLNPWDETQRMIALSLSWDAENKKALAFPLDHRACKLTLAQREILCKRLTAMFAKYKVASIMHNGKFDAQWVNHAYGLELPEAEWDTMLIEHQLDEDKTGEYSLKKLTRDYYPGAGKYEDELKDFLENEKQKRLTEHKKQCAVLNEKQLEVFVAYWVGLQEADRLRLVSGWMNDGLLSDLKDPNLLITLERRKATAKMIKEGVEPPIYKRCEALIQKALEQVPLQEFPKEVQAALVPFAPDEALLNKVTFEDVPLPVMLKYAAIDAVMTRLIVRKQMIRLSREMAKEDELAKRFPEGFFALKQDVLHGNKVHTAPLSSLLADMEYNGVKVDREKIKTYRDHLALKAEETKHELLHLVGYEFNPSSDADLIKILYEEKKMEVLKRTLKGNTPSTDAATLLNLYDKTEDEFLKTLLLYRKLEKCKSTYLENWLRMSAVDGKIHCSFNQNGTATYRLSSSNPNLQNVMFYLRGVEAPDTPGKDMNLKSCFLPDSEEFDLYDLDISNAEMRILCAYSRDETLTNAFLNGMDMHCLTAEGICDDQFTYDEIKANKDSKGSEQFKFRQVAKAVNFGTIFCMGAATLQRNLWDKTRVAISEDKAQAYLDLFFQKYPGVQRYIEDTINFTMRHHWAYTFTGRRRRFPNLAYDRKARNRCGRQAVNARIQTSSSDVVGKNMVDTDREFIKPNGGRMLLTVHDSMVFQAPKGLDPKWVRGKLDKIILDGTAESFPWLPVPWKYDVDRGDSYGTASGF